MPLPQGDYVLCLGANTPDAASRIDEATAFIGRHGTITAATPPYRTEPEYAGDKAPYLNRVLVLDSPLDPGSLQHIMKTYERGVRALCSHPGYVNLDIDIVMHGTTVLRPRDFHAAYFKKALELF